MNAQKKSFSVLGLLEAATVAVCVGTIISFLARLWWVFELSCHFRPHQAALLWLASIFWLCLKRRRLALVCGTLALVNTLMVAVLFLPLPKRETEPDHRLRLASLNVHTFNTRSDLVLGFLRDSDADVILLMEVDDRWMNELTALNEYYPHHLALPRPDNFGIALFSRLPLTNSNIIEIGSAEVPSIATEIEWHDRRFFLLGTHPLPPGSSAYAGWRNEQLQDMAALVRTQSLPVVVMGDLNATPWSPYFSKLLKESGLLNTSQGLGMFNSWPAPLVKIGIPIDHCLVSSSWVVADKRTGPVVGGDHLPIIVDLLPAVVQKK